jgi:hypothetical protein
MASEYTVLTEAQAAQFIDRGHVALPGAFDPSDAAEAREFLWERLAERGVLKDDPATWTEPMVRIREVYDAPAFRACDTELIADAIEDLIGRGRWRERGQVNRWGWWPVNFAEGADRPWTVPATGWHWDGIHFRHTVDAPDQGLLLLCTFSDVVPHGGGTLVAEGSHEVAARFLARHPEGMALREAYRACASEHPWLSVLTGETEDAKPDDRVRRFMDEEFVDDHGTRLRVVEVTANAGDVILCHPLLYHAASQNHAGIPRFMCNRTTPLRENMQLEREDGDYSPVEASLRRALGRQASSSA